MAGTGLAIVDEVPARVLCQGPHGGCAACCGVWNFRDRSDDAMRARLARRTAAVRAAWPDRARLAAARDELVAKERDEILTPAIPVCPFAGLLDDDGDGAPRVGCLLHPTRHPRGEDLRDLAVYPREVCAGHFCAPHTWLTDVEKDVAQRARGLHYGRVVTDAGFVKALVKLIEDGLGRRLRSDDVARGAAAFTTLFHVLAAWPFADPDPRRFGGFFLDDDGGERTVAREAPFFVPTGPRRHALDALGTLLDDEPRVREAVRALDGAIAAVVAALDAPPTADSPAHRLEH